MYDLRHPMPDHQGRSHLMDEVHNNIHVLVSEDVSSESPEVKTLIESFHVLVQELRQRSKQGEFE